MRISDWSSDVCSSDLIVDLVSGRPERFIIFCDDLSFEEGEPGYKALKSVLDGSVSASGDNVLIYATSNRRHLMPEYMSENISARSEEHTSELQSLMRISYALFCLKKKKNESRN